MRGVRSATSFSLSFNDASHLRPLIFLLLGVHCLETSNMHLVIGMVNKLSPNVDHIFGTANMWEQVRRLSGWLGSNFNWFLLGHAIMVLNNVISWRVLIILNFCSCITAICGWQSIKPLPWHWGTDSNRLAERTSNKVSLTILSIGLFRVTSISATVRAPSRH